MPPELLAACEALRLLLLNRLLRFHGGGLLLFFLHGMLEIFDSFADAFSYLRDFLAPEEESSEDEKKADVYSFAIW